MKSVFPLSDIVASLAAGGSAHLGCAAANAQLPARYRWVSLALRRSAERHWFRLHYGKPIDKVTAEIARLKAVKF
jgi:hypothetical protein